MRDGIVGRGAAFQRREPDEGFERRTRLPLGIGDAIELAILIVFSTDHGADGTIGRKRNQRSLRDAEFRALRIEFIT